MLGRKDRATFIRIWNKLQDHTDTEKSLRIKKRNLRLSPEQVIVCAMATANVEGRDIAEKILDLQQEISV